MPEPVSVADWRRFLPEYSTDLLRLTGGELYDVDGEGFYTDADEELVSSGFLGHAPASEEQVLAAEHRLGAALPPSYRNFLLTSNGLAGPGTPWMYALLPVEQAGWLRESPGMDRILADAWTPEVYGEKAGAMFARALWPTPPGDGDYWLLDPGDVGPDGEWTAYSWAASSGFRPEPHRSFGAMIAAEYADMLAVLTESD